MPELVNNNITVIKQNDPDIPEYLDFEKLRKEGLEHIGNLSGKIWTDHNLHDPGITILEVLIYALMDLGYKTNLPFEDLITVGDEADKDDNFLTPLDILTINPVTISDYRKLLLEIEGVRNAWLEPVPQQRDLYLDGYSNTLFCDGFLDLASRRSVAGPKNRYGYQKIELNGLYNVYIEKDRNVSNDLLIEKVTSLLSEHRNLCEDFEEIKILTPLDIGVCVEVEIHAEFEAEKVYIQILNGLKKYIQPEIRYYTLNELLDKGKTIEEIFAGRPYRTESFGFVDTEELESFERREYINLSDIYNVVLTIEGVRKIKTISISNTLLADQEAPNWRYRIPEEHVPVFSLDKTCIELFNTKGFLKVDKARIHRSLSTTRQFSMPLQNLNTEIPQGRQREDLNEYYSIQNDFPIVYGIGEDGLPESATLLRETQALQLKGYLMFYDQMLANYTSQLSQIRSLFSLKPESQRTEEEKQTYFTQVPGSVPEIEKLLRFYANDTSVTKGSLLAVPIANDLGWQQLKSRLKKDSGIELIIDNACNNKNALLDLFSFSATGVRSIYINQLVDSFFNKNYSIEVISDRRGHFFVIQPVLPDDIVIVGINRYKTEGEAINEARNVAFLATMRQSYNLMTNPSVTLDPDQHYFDLTYNPVSYIEIIQELTEDKNEYAIRRKQFLDHLLARFGEEFTDFTILQYQNKIETSSLTQKEIDKASEYINEFAEVSHNRGRAFDYSAPSWNTDNVSGFEKRISLLSGIEKYTRRNLCNFEVVQNFRILLKDWNGNVLFRSNSGYESKEELYSEARKVLTQIRNPEAYKRLEKSLNSFNTETTHRIFSEMPSKENIFITKYDYHQELIDSQGNCVVRSKSMKMRSEKAAIEKRDDFIKEINKQDVVADPHTKNEYRLLPLDIENSYLDTNALNCEIETLITWKWHIKDTVAKQEVSSQQIFENYNDAWEDMVREAELNNYLTSYDIGVKWRLSIDKNISIIGVECYPDAYKAVTAWRQSKVLGSEKSNYDIEQADGHVRIKIKNEKGAIIAVSNDIDPAFCNLETIAEECVAIFGNRNTKPDYANEKEKFGFQIIGKDKKPTLMSYCVYDSEKEALQHIETVFKLGDTKKNYLLSGDQGNPEYNFILRDQYNSFLALPPDHFETAADRTKVLNTIIRHIKNNTLPVLVKEEPRRYVWSLVRDEKKVLESEAEFSSKNRAQNDFDKTVAAEAAKGTNELFTPYCYNFEVVATPALYKFRYGISNAKNELEPILASTNTFKTYEEASSGYTGFIRKLPGLVFKVSPKNETDYGLYVSGSKTPIVRGVKKEKSAAEKTRKLVTYISGIYSKNLVPKESFVTRSMIENQNGRFEWRFYKKNAPLAINPNTFTNESDAERIKTSICDVIPPIDLRQCPVRSVIICPDGNPNQYHYEVRFKDIKNNEFVLISYIGYTSEDAAKEAWEKEWFRVIQLAANPEEYKESGKINIEESYKDPESKSCDHESFLVVIPKVIRDQVEAEERDIVDHYTRLAVTYPICEILEDDTENMIYKYKVVELQDTVIEEESSAERKNTWSSSIIWISENCYNDTQEAIEAYQFFYNLADNSNNCRVLCGKKGFYVGLVEVLAESSQEFASEADAWDDAYPEKEDTCDHCVPGGVRAFIYAADEDKNYITTCDQDYWKFKVVSSDYFVADHTCFYSSKMLRDEQINNWISKLENLNWDDYITEKPTDSGGTHPGGDLLFWIGYGYSDKQFCEFMFNLRDSLDSCLEEGKRNEAIRTYLIEKYKDDSRVLSYIRNYDFKYESIQYLTNYFPIYKTENGYCYRLYFAEDDIKTTPGGLQPCGCEPEVILEENPCNEPYPLASSNYYGCCTEALLAFTEFCMLIADPDKAYTIEGTAKTAYGPYSFQIIDKSKELAYHPQQYDSFQEVTNAIQITKDCVQDVGMHLLEHILLRPTPNSNCIDYYDSSENEEGNDFINCLLPICPDYECCIEWQLDFENDDPCASADPPPSINYIPGSDPYSFWATLVLPSWTKQFRSLEQRMAFEKFLYKETPALVGLNILWLSPHDLCDFEDAYHNWLVWKQDPTAHNCHPDTVATYCLVAEYIRDLRSEPPCPSGPEDAGDCNCDEKATNVPAPDSIESIFWADCTTVSAYQDAYEGVAASEQASKEEPTLVNKEKEKPKKQEVSASRKEIKDTSQKKATVKSTSKAPHKKTTKRSRTSEKAKKDDLTTIIRKRKPKYISNVESVADDNMKKTKSYERAVFFLQNTPTVAAYKKLVDFFDRYSLQKDNNQHFMVLVKNATFHLFDKLVLDKEATINEEDVAQLSNRFDKLKDKGLSAKELDKEWNSKELGSMANAERVAQIKKILT